MLLLLPINLIFIKNVFIFLSYLSFIRNNNMTDDMDRKEGQERPWPFVVDNQSTSYSSEVASASEDEDTSMKSDNAGVRAYSVIPDASASLNPEIMTIEVHWQRKKMICTCAC